VTFLIPTRNRVELLRIAVDSVMAQSDPDFEIAIADNCSDDGTAEYCANLEDPRVRVSVSDSSLPVTANWNRALRLGTGRYVVMLGDDDAVLPGYVARIRELAETWPECDVVYHGAWLFSAPDVDPGEPLGYVQDNAAAAFLRGATEPSVLSAAVRTRMVAGALDFRYRYGFNMQYAALRRDFLERVWEHGEVFTSDFPDYFAMNLAMIDAQAILAVPENLVIIGVSRKSYGFFHLNQQESRGREFLQGEDHSVAEVSVLDMPGSYINTGWLAAMLALEERIPDRLPRTPNVPRFRWLQAVSIYRGRYWDGRCSGETVREMEWFLPGWQRVAGRCLFPVAGALSRFVPARVRPSALGVLETLLTRQIPIWRPSRHRPVEDMSQALEWIGRGFSGT